jgi:hypothetical protein
MFVGASSGDGSQNTAHPTTDAGNFNQAFDQAKAAAAGAQSDTGGPHPNPPPSPRPVVPPSRHWAGPTPHPQPSPAPVSPNKSPPAPPASSQGSSGGQYPLPPSMSYYPKPTGAQWYEFGLGFGLFAIGVATLPVSVIYGREFLEGPEPANNFSTTPKWFDALKSAGAWGGISGSMIATGEQMMLPVQDYTSDWYMTHAPNMPENPGA